MTLAIRSSSSTTSTRTHTFSRRPDEHQMNRSPAITTRSHRLLTVGPSTVLGGEMRKAIVVVGLAALLGAGCGSGSRPSRFVQRVDNPWFPLRPGTTLVYRGVKDGKPSRDVVTVTGTTTVIDGVRCTTVKDVLYLKGKLEERTTDWYAQDTTGNVW